MPETIIEIRNASKNYLDRGGHALEVLRNVNLEVREGEFLSILGVSGCGKSTLLNVMGGFEDLTRGQALFRGDPISGPSADRGVCFQEYALFPWKTVRDNVEFGLKVKGMSGAERHRVSSHYLDMVGLLASQHKYPHELSGGMRQRCSLARTFANDPAVLLMDEPLAAVDAQTRLVLQSELMNIWGQTKPVSERKTIIYITHSIEEAVFLSDRVAVMARSPAGSPRSSTSTYRAPGASRPVACNRSAI